MKKSFVSLAAVVILAGCAGLPGFPGLSDSSKNSQVNNPSASTATPEPDLFPLVEGATWTFKNYQYANPDESGSGVFKGSKTLSVVSVEKSGDLATASIKETDYSNDGKETGFSNYLYVRDTDGFYLQENASSQRTLLVPIPLSVSSTILEPASTSTSVYSLGTTWSTASANVRTIANGQSLTTDAGKLSACFHVSTNQTFYSSSKYIDSSFGSDASTSSSDVWIAPGVGIVKTRTARTIQALTSSSAYFNSYPISFVFGTTVSTYSIPH